MIMASPRKGKDQSLSLDNTKEKPSKEPHRFKPGNNGHGGGRPLGSRNKFAEQFIKDFIADWEVAGPSAIQNCRLVDPAAYLRIAASLVPKEFNLNNRTSLLDAIVEQLNDEQLGQLIDGLTAIGAAAQGEGHEAEASARGKSNGVHQVLLPSAG